MDKKKAGKTIKPIAIVIIILLCIFGAYVVGEYTVHTLKSRAVYSTDVNERKLNITNVELISGSELNDDELIFDITFKNDSIWDLEAKYLFFHVMKVEGNVPDFDALEDRLYVDSWHLKTEFPLVVEKNSKKTVRYYSPDFDRGKIILIVSEISSLLYTEEFYLNKPAELALSLSEKDITVDERGRVDYKYSVKNIGDFSGEFEVQIKIDDSKFRIYTYALEPGEEIIDKRYFYMRYQDKVLNIGGIEYDLFKQKPDRPVNGRYLTGGRNATDCKMHVENELDYDIVVAFYDVDNDFEQYFGSSVAVYIRAGETFDIVNLIPARTGLEIFAGDEWNYTENEFNLNATRFVLIGYIDIQQIHDDENHIYSGSSYSITVNEEFLLEHFKEDASTNVGLDDDNPY